MCHGVTFPPTMPALVLFNGNYAWILRAVMRLADSRGKAKLPPQAHLLSEGSELSSHGRRPLGPGPPSLACHFFLFLLLLLAITVVFFNPKRQRRSSNLPSPLQSVKADAADTGRWGGLTARSSQAVSEEGQQVECFSDGGRSALPFLPELLHLLLSVPPHLWP